MIRFSNILLLIAVGSRLGMKKKVMRILRSVRYPRRVKVKVNDDLETIEA